jgi:hypothetical protein
MPLREPSLMSNVMGRGDALTFGQRHFMQGGSAWVLADFTVQPYPIADY